MKKDSKSGSGKQPSTPRGKVMADDEHQLWEHAARSIHRLKRLKPRVGTADVADTVAPPRRPGTVEPQPKHKSVSTRVPPPHVPTPKKSAPPIAEFDRKKVRKIGTGQIEIDARIDLHGLTQSEAHAALTRFIHRSAARGDRLVLIVTGKGSMARRAVTDTDSYSAEPNPGVLRRNVPRWLEEPALHGLVVSYTTAQIRHGGEGALYVHLRTKK